MEFTSAVQAQPANLSQPRATRRPVQLSRGACRGIAAGVLLAIFLTNVCYLTFNCPISLAEDEAYYWDWSRRLDLSYYSKGPLVAYLIRASCAVFGDVMPAVRLPAMLLAIGTGVITYSLTLRMFRSDRLALASLLLSLLPPIAAARGLVMTIDPPLYFCWAAAMLLAYLAAFEGRRAAWLGVGVMVGLGLLAKFSMSLWFLGLATWFVFDRPSRFHLKRPMLWLGMLIAVVFTTPIVLWNARHGWPTAYHVSHNIGLGPASRFSIGSVIDFWTGQLGVVGPVMFLLVAAACATAITSSAAGRDADVCRSHSIRRRMRFLLCMGLPVFAAVFIASFRTNPGANWVAPGYFSLLILTTWVVARKLTANAFGWRTLVSMSILSSLVLIFFAYRSESLYTLYGNIAPRLGLPLETIKVDPTARLRGWAEFGERLGRELEALGEGAFILTDTYPHAAQAAFHTPGRPMTYFVGSYFCDARYAKALSQYDMWPDRDLAQQRLLGRDAIYVGEMHPELRSAFESVEALPDVTVERRGVAVRHWTLWRCRGFNGLSRPAGTRKYWTPS